MNGKDRLSHRPGQFPVSHFKIPHFIEVGMAREAYFADYIREAGQ